MPKKKDSTTTTMTPVPEPTLSSSERIEQTSSINGQAFTAGIIRKELMRYAHHVVRDPKGYKLTDPEDVARVFSACLAHLNAHALPLHEEHACRKSLTKILDALPYDEKIFAQQGEVVFPKSSPPLAFVLYVFDKDHYAYVNAWEEAQIAEWKQKQAEKKEAEEEQSVGEE
jgi:hypothetical protein